MGGGLLIVYGGPLCCYVLLLKFGSFIFYRAVPATNIVVFIKSILIVAWGSCIGT